LAKRSKQAPDGAAETEAGPAVNDAAEGRTQDVLGDFAADLGGFLGNVQNRATSWLQQRKDIADQLTQIRDTANQYLQQLGAESAHLAERFEKARRGRPPGSGKTPPPAGSSTAPAPGTATRKRTMSAEARARIAEAQRQRWAKVRRKKT
jgi:hypothetical protein